MQNIFPSLTRARGISVYLLVFYAGMSIGSIAWGAIAQWITLSSTLLIASIFLALMGLAAMRVLAEKKLFYALLPNLKSEILRVIPKLSQIVLKWPKIIIFGHFFILEILDRI